MKKYIFTFMTMLATLSVCKAQKVSEESFIGTWKSGDIQVKFTIANNSLQCDFTTEEERWSSDDVMQMDSAVYVEHLLEERNGKEFSRDVVMNTSKENPVVQQAASVLGNKCNQPSKTESPNDKIYRKRTLKCIMRGDTLWVEIGIVEEHEGPGILEYRHGNKIESCNLRKEKR